MFNYQKSQRITKTKEFRLNLDHGQKIFCRDFLFFAISKEEAPTRVGLIASRKVGGAVVRNRVKRYLRETFRHNTDKFNKHWDIVVVAKHKASLTSFEDVNQGFLYCIRQLNRTSSFKPFEKSEKI